MYYFAYGSNLNKKLMLDCCPDSEPKFIANLPNYKLVFVGWSRQWRGGVASIRPFRGEKVPGAVYEISDKDLKRLDNHESCSGRYTRLNVTVFDEDGGPIKAITYIKFEQSNEAQLSKEYLASIQLGYRDWGIT
jgi:gamma-glutamylcyclotransferase (GGCT)/AIG2-like uncharacterized protein YtfP